MINFRPSFVAWIFILPALASGMPICKSNAAEDSTLSARFFERARTYLYEDRLQEALHLLERSFEAGYKRPADVLKDSSFQVLRHHAELRQQLRTLLRKFTTESHVSMVNSTEDGDPLVLTGKVVHFDTGQPVKGALIYFFHTDSKGLYAPEHLRAGHGANNPRLFCYLRTDENGHFQIRTIRPASYPGYNNMRHIHFLISAVGFAKVNSQLYINGDPAADQNRRNIAADRGWPIVNPSRTDDGQYHAELEIKIHPVQ